MLPLWDSHKLKRPGAVTRTLVVVNLVVFAIETALHLWQPDWFEQLLARYALVPSAWWGHAGEAAAWIPVFSSMFLHGSWAHVGGNCWFLWVFGRSLEDHVGAGRFALIYLGAGVGAAALQTGVDPSSSVPMVGASGAISGVLGAYLVLLAGRWIVALVPWVVPIIPVPAVVFLVLWFGLQLVNGLGGWGGQSTGGVAWWAHVGGFVTGVAMAQGMRSGRGKTGRRKKT